MISHSMALWGPTQTRPELGLLLSTVSRSLGRHPQSHGKLLPTLLATPRPTSQPRRHQVPPQVSRHKEGNGSQPCLMLGVPGPHKLAPRLVTSKRAWVSHKLYGTHVIYPLGSCQHRCLGTEGCHREEAQ